ncbi:hypothetical protein F5Y14DRAFT_236290 [Nemania sp. NC0429]|nr:hypothetical protein F5Y14DRAFT_236290 [Nemania sp. NC0429]
MKTPKRERERGRTRATVLAPRLGDEVITCDDKMLIPDNQAKEEEMSAVLARPSPSHDTFPFSPWSMLVKTSLATPTNDILALVVVVAVVAWFFLSLLFLLAVDNAEYMRDSVLSWRRKSSNKTAARSRVSMYYDEAKRPPTRPWKSITRW